MFICISFVKSPATRNVLPAVPTSCRYDGIKRRNTVRWPHVKAYVKTGLRKSQCFESSQVIMSRTEEVFLMKALLYCLLIKKQQRNKQRRCRSRWSKTWLLRRNIHSHVNLIEDLREDPEDWRSYLRMDETAYIELLRLVTPIIKKEDTVMRRSISPHERLSCTLRFLATGRTYRDLRFSAAISHQALSRIIPDTCKAIYHVLHKEYMKVSQTCLINKIINKRSKIPTNQI